MPWQLLDHPTASQGEIAILSSGCWFCKNDNCPMGGYTAKVAVIKLGLMKA